MNKPLESDPTLRMKILATIAAHQTEQREAGVPTDGRIVFAELGKIAAELLAASPLDRAGRDRQLRLFVRMIREALPERRIALAPQRRGDVS